MKKILLLLSILVMFNWVNAQPGTLDPSFGNNGFILTQPPASGNLFQSLAKSCLLPGDGSMYFVLQATAKTKINRRLSNGAIDASYSNNGFSDIVSLYTNAAALQADGKIVVGGTDGNQGLMLARYTTAGTLDPTFGNNGIVISRPGDPYRYLNALVITPDGKIIIGGQVFFNGKGQFFIARYTTSGTLDNSYGNNGIVTTDFNGSNAMVSSLALQTDGKLIASGVAFGPGGSDFALARYNPDGSKDLSFHNTGETTSDFSFSDWARSVVVDATGKIYAGGQSYDNTGTQRFTIARYNSDGSPDLGFNGGTGFVWVTAPTSFDILINIALQSDGKIIAAGHADHNGNYDAMLARVNTNGTVDNSFGNNGNGIVYADINSFYDESDCLAVQSDDKIITGGLTVNFSPYTSHYTGFRYTANGAPDNSFDNDGYFMDFVPGFYYNYGVMFHQNDGKLLAISSFYDGTTTASIQSLNRLNADGSIDNSYGTNGSIALPNTTGPFVFQPDGKLLELNFENGDFRIVRHNADGSLDASFGNNGTAITDFGGEESPSTACVQPDGKIIIGGLTRDANGVDMLVARYNPNGTLDNSFGISGYLKVDIANEENVLAIAMSPDGKIVLGGISLSYPPDFSFFRYDAIIMRLNPDGSIDNSFANQGKLIIDRSDFDILGSLLVQNDKKIVFTCVASADGSFSNFSLERINENGSPDNSFGQNSKVQVDWVGLLAQEDQKFIISGYVINDQNNAEIALARYDTNGNLDPSFGTNGKTFISLTANDNYVFAGLVSGNRLFASGYGVDHTGTPLGIIAKFRLDVERSITCPPNKTVNTDAGLCSAIVNNIDPTVSPSNEAFTYQLSGATTGSGNGTASGKTFNKGTTTVTYTLTSDATKTCSFTVTVEDHESPVVHNLSASPNSLWPPNHKMHDITVSYTATDNCGIATTQVSVSSNEPVQSNESGDQSPDWQIIDNHHIKLRAERLGSGNGRIYTINVTTTDLSGNQVTNSTTVTVPHSMGNGRLELITEAAPNPSSNYFVVTINSSSDERAQLRLMNSQGVVVETINNVNPVQTLKIGEKLLSGIYYLEINQSGMIKTIKLVKL